jgi:lipopolysaccharide/colanic/teichoic acid biosynthesis glycosyltransferase
MSDLDSLQAEGLPSAPADLIYRRAGYVVTALGSVLVLLVLPQVYGFIVSQLSHAPVTPRMTMHIFANCSANTIAMLAAWGFKGRFHEKVAQVLNTVMLSHGLLAVVIVATHSVYSNWVLLASATASIVLGGGIVTVTRLRDGPRIALVALPTVAPRDVSSRAERITDPEADLRGYDLILIPSAGAFPSDWAASLSRAMLAGKPVRHIAEYQEESRGQVSVEHFDVDDLPRGGLTSYRSGKRMLDVLIVVASLPVVIPVLLVAALAIRLSMGGPVLFFQDRVGLGGNAFRMVKLRTMRQASELDGAATTGDDARITPLGRFLRRYRIDELPQLWHIARGEMSLIGPRPEWTVLADEYERQVPAYAFRQIVRPGLTGWAQVNSGYAANVEEMRVKLGFDLYYLKNFSLALDLQVLARTAWVLLSGSGAR